MTKSDPIRVTSRVVGDVTVVRIVGDIDLDFAATTPFKDAGRKLIIDLDGARRITAFGVREWMRALATTSTEYLGFINCRPSLVAQFNSVNDFGKAGTLITIYLPYLCSACGTEIDVLVDLRQPSSLSQDQPETIPCTTCGGTAEFDDLSHSYFAFARRQGVAQVPPEVSAAFSAHSSPPPSPLRVDKEVSADATFVSLTGTLDARSARILRRVLDGVEGRTIFDLSGLHDVDEEGAERLGVIVAQGDIVSSLARVPVRLVPTLFAKRVDALANTLVSLLVDGVCVRCQSVRRTDIHGDAMLAFLERKPSGAWCTTCGAPLRVDVDPSVLALARSVVCARPTPAVVGYLGRRIGKTPAPPSSSPPSTPAAAAAAKQPARPTGGAVPTEVGGYEVLRRIGHGGMAEVLLARQRGIAGFEKPVVIKRILSSLADQPDVVEMLLQEAKVAARISHPNVVQIFDLGISDDQYFIAMEFVNGSDLAVLIRAGRRMGKPAPFAVAARIVADVAAGLQAAHALTDASGAPAPVVHRDISPHNIMLSAEGAVKLTDFGISKVSDSVVHTMTGVLKGKVPYMAPEQLDSRYGVTDHRIDIYQAGVVLAELLLGYSPFHRKSEAESMGAALKGELPDPLPPCQPIPPALLPIVKKAIARSPKDRYASAEDLQVALEAAIRQLGGQGSDHDVAQWASSLAEAPVLPLTSDEDSQTEVVTPRKRRGPPA